jgi:hypothetical protein
MNGRAEEGNEVGTRSSDGQRTKQRCGNLDEPILGLMELPLGIPLVLYHRLLQPFRIRQHLVSQQHSSNKHNRLDARHLRLPELGPRPPEHVRLLRLGERVGETGRTGSVRIFVGFGVVAARGGRGTEGLTFRLERRGRGGGGRRACRVKGGGDRVSFGRRA